MRRERRGDAGTRGRGEMRETNQFKIQNSKFKIKELFNAQCPMPLAPCPMPNYAGS
ncbi:MAG: hypothetical protein RMY29_033335 [Nostoc sp. CreGUA01]|nr:hypothetical protein [Nostoc sp. CreGUA01]